MRLISAADCRRMPWKNGGGETIEIAVHPAGAGLDDFDWRVSMALVEADGPFSEFAGVDRTLAVLEGEGLLLHVEGREPVRLTARSEPLAFPADVATRASLIAGPITDLNVMSRRGRVAHSVVRLVVHERMELSTDTLTTLILCQSGEIKINAQGRTDMLRPFDAILAEQRDTGIVLEADAPAVLLKVDLRSLHLLSTEPAIWFAKFG